ncbi:hypothetical protein OAF30_02895 [Flavobacteriales bacterium]|nr:hypothetical protein [Flavobacteriales bacterium]
MLSGAFGINQSLAQTIAAGLMHSLALKEDGTVVAWGNDSWSPCEVPSGLKNVTAIKAVAQHFLALKQDGTVVSWGDNSRNQCNIPSGLKDVVAVGTGDWHSLALKEDGTVVAWGSNVSKQCNVPSGLKDVVAVDAGNGYSLALKEDGTVIAWGSNVSKQCNVPSGLKDVVAIEAGAAHSLVLIEDGTVVTWGSSKKTQRNVPIGLKDVVAVAAGLYHSLALREDGTVVAWGWNENNQCDVPSGLKDVVAIQAGCVHSLALKEDGTVVAWGGNDDNQCDVPSGLKAALPTKSEISFSNDPPILSIDPSTIRFTDINPNQSLAGNGALDAMDRAELSFIIENTGPGPGRNLYADVSISGATDGLAWVSPWPMPAIPPGASEEASSYTIFSDRKTVDGVIEVTIEVKEPNGFSPEPFKVEIETRAFRAPKLEVVDFTSSLSTWKPNTPIGLDILVQNTGIGTAHDLSVELTLPDAVNCYSNNTSIEVASLAPGETIPITYDMIVPRNFDQSRVQANLTVTETFGDYGTNWTHGFPFEGGSSNGAVVSIDATAADGEVSTDRAALIKNSSKPSDVSFNQVPKDIIVTTVAVLPIDGKDCNGEMISGQDIASFTEGSLLGLYNVVERRNLERVLDEQKLALSGLIYEKSAVEAGCNVGAQGIIFTEYGCLTGQETIQLKLVDCQTSELYWSATGVNATAKETLDKVREELER